MRIQVLLTVFLLAATLGCTSTRTTDTSRTGIEQLLISNAIDQTLDKTPLPPIDGRKVFLDPQFLDCVDKGYVVGSIRQRLLSNGAKMVDKKEDSEVTMEIYSGGLGTDNVDSFLGVPGMALPGPIPIEIPEVRVYEKSSQFGTAKIGLTAYATATGELVYDSGRHLPRAGNSRWSVMGVGPFQTGTVLNEVNSNTQKIDLSARIANAIDATEDR